MNAKAKEDWTFKDKGVYYVPGLNNGKHTPGVYFQLRYGIVVGVNMGDRTLPTPSYPFSATVAYVLGWTRKGQFQN